MIKRRNSLYTLNDLYKALFERKTSKGKINKVIDAFFEDDIVKDNLLHFMNEAIIHKDFKTFVRNFKKYTLKKHLVKFIEKKL